MSPLENELEFPTLLKVIWRRMMERRKILVIIVLLDFIIFRIIFSTQRTKGINILQLITNRNKVTGERNRLT